MNRSEIKLDHCYSMTSVNGRRTIARVTKLFQVSAMTAYPEGNETLELNPTAVQYVWRYAAYPRGWSTKRRQLLLDAFALAAENEVACT